MARIVALRGWCFFRQGTRHEAAGNGWSRKGVPAKALGSKNQSGCVVLLHKAETRLLASTLARGLSFFLQAHALALCS